MEHPKATPMDKHAKASLPLQSDITTYVSASQLHKDTPFFVIKPVRKHESKWKYFRDFPLKLQT